MLGLNSDSFPRKDKALSFDLMSKEKRKGDRSIKENDKHLFLETLLSAQDYFYISYVGQNIVSNAELPASALVDELINYIRQNRVEGVESSCPLYKQPLQSQSLRYMDNEFGVYTYLGQQAVNLPEIFAIGSKENILQKEIPLQKLIRFLLDPVAGYYNDVLNIRYEDPEIALPESEIFETDSLQNWDLKNKLLHMDATEVDAWQVRQKKNGFLPLKNSGNLLVKTVAEEIKRVKEIFQELKKDRVQSAESFSLQLNNVLLTGTFENIYGDKMIAVSFSKNETKYLIRSYISLLVAKALGLPASLVFISALKNDSYKAADVSQTEARSRLEEIYSLYEMGHENMLCFSSRFKIDIRRLSEDMPGALEKSVADLFGNSTFPCTDPYLLRQKGLGFFENKTDSFQRYAELLLLPLLEIFPAYFE